MNPGAAQTSKDLQKMDVPLYRLQNDAELREIYEFGRTLGQGSFGVVYEATHIETQSKWAIKEVCRSAAGTSKASMQWEEINILKQVNHPHIIQVHAIYHTSTMIYLVTELCRGGDLKQLLQMKKFFTEDETRSIMHSLAGAVVYLHKRDIVHRDLKLENILVRNALDEDDGKIYIKVTDFGLSVKTEGVGLENRISQACGTLIYMAPEVMSDRRYSQWCDVWSMGVVMYMLLCGKPPFIAKTRQALLEKIKKRQVNFDKPIWDTVSDAAKNLLSCLLKADPAYRMSASQLLENPWITGDTDMPAVPSNMLEMMRQHLEQEEGEQGLEASSRNSSEDDLDQVLVAQVASTETDVLSSSQANLSPRDNHNTSSGSTAAIKSGGMKTKTRGPLQDTHHSSSDTSVPPTTSQPDAGMKACGKQRKPQDRRDSSTGQKTGSSQSKADDNGPSTSSKVDQAPTSSQLFQKPLAAQNKSKK